LESDENKRDVLFVKGSHHQTKLCRGAFRKEKYDKRNNVILVSQVKKLEGGSLLKKVSIKRYEAYKERATLR
jgi:hypothetical protein